MRYHLKDNQIKEVQEDKSSFIDNLRLQLRETLNNKKTPLNAIDELFKNNKKK